MTIVENSDRPERLKKWQQRLVELGIMMLFYGSIYVICELDKSGNEQIIGCSSPLPDNSVKNADTFTVYQNHLPFN